VRDGEKINIWRDSWIPTSANRKVTTVRGTTLLTKVSQLIDPHTGQWHEVLVHDIFNSLDAWRILQIPLNPNGFSDFIAWALTKHGFYTVRSAFHCQWHHQFGGVAPQMSLPGASAANPVWRTLWKLQVPGKVNFFCLEDIAWNSSIKEYTC
jgi:hypothetical protein